MPAMGHVHRVHVHHIDVDHANVHLYKIHHTNTRRTVHMQIMFLDGFVSFDDVSMLVLCSEEAFNKC